MAQIRSASLQLREAKTLAEAIYVQRTWTSFEIYKSSFHLDLIVTLLE